MGFRKVVCLSVVSLASVLGKEQIDRDVIIPVEMVEEVQTIEAAPIFECEPNSGATLNADGTCTALKESKKKHHCPKGTSQSRTGDGCIKRDSLAPIAICASGVLSGKKCLSIETAPATMECARGYIMSENGLCSPDGDKHHAKHHCGKGARLDGDVCISVQSVKPQYLCESGLLNGQNCDEEESMPPTCRNGEDPISGQCMSHKKSKTSHNCPHGYNSNRNGECTKKIVAEAVTECEEGSFLEGRNCVLSESIALEYKCKSKGFTLEGNKCVKYLEEQPQASCPRGYKEMDGGCVQHHNKQSNTTCPPNFELKGAKCIGEEILPATESCQDGELINGECVSTEVERNALTCQRGWKLKDGICIKHHSNRAHKTCPPGSIEEGHKCVIKTSLAAEQECERGEEMLADGMCGSTESRAPDYVCGHGYKLAKDGVLCNKETYTSPAKACPSGYELDGRSCVSEESSDMLAECESGSISKAGACLEIVTTKASPKCEDGFSMKRGTCYKRVTVQVPSVVASRKGNAHGHGASKARVLKEDRYSKSGSSSKH